VEEVKTHHEGTAARIKEQICRRFAQMIADPNGLVGMRLFLISAYLRLSAAILLLISPCLRVSVVEFI
jgi:hypothetical protein